MKKKTSNEKHQKKHSRIKRQGKIKWNKKKVLMTGSICLVLVAVSGGAVWKLTSQSADGGSQNAMQEGEMPGKECREQ